MPACVKCREEPSDIDFIVRRDQSKPLPVQRVSLCRALKRISRHEVDIVSIDGAKTRFSPAELGYKRGPYIPPRDLTRLLTLRERRQDGRSPANGSEVWLPGA
jgi:hypothetical protein